MSGDAMLNHTFSCHIIIHTSECDQLRVYALSSYILCHIIIHTMSHHHTYYVTSSYVLYHIIMHALSHHHTYTGVMREATAVWWRLMIRDTAYSMMIPLRMGRRLCGTVGIIFTARASAWMQGT